MAGGVYLVTGARGGIGTPLSAHLAERYKAKLVLVGRSAVPDGDLARLRALGAEVMAIKADVTDLSQVRSAVDAAIRSFGRLDGVFHLAGVAEPPGAGLSDAPTFRRVLGPKLSGLIALDQATAALPLSLFVAFSSISSVVGDFGNGSYAAANRSVDVYMTRRARWVASGHRRGRSLSLAWPLWDGTGMNTLLTPSEIAASTARTGMRPLPVVQALLAMEQALGREESLLVPALGDAPAIDRALAGGGPDKTVVPAAPPAGTTETGQAEGVAVVRDHLLATVAGVLKIPAGQIDIRQPLSGYGLDSVLVMETIALLGKDFPGLRGTVLFEFPSIAELAAHIVAAHGSAVGRLAAGRSPAPPMVPVPPPLPAAKAAPAQAAKAAPAAVPAVIRDISGIPVTGPASSDAIAVIGMAGRYPDADTLDEFWDNLSRGRDSVGEVPPARWNAQALFDADPDAEGRSYGRWGAFLTDVDCFDSLFFQIAPAQAKLMDPQERLFLETAWAALEDAGYPPSRLPRPRFGNGGRDVGVFVGVMWDDYAILAADEARGGNHFLVLANRSGIANQLSYFCDFRGPSQVIDTACSSSLVALHQACESLRRGECAYAVAGGVNVAAHPLRYVHLSRKKMLSRDGRCRSFGDGGTGYVPGEGVGAVLLKPLSRALADGDHIRAVIRASAVNHGGRTTGYTVPNPHAQQAVIEEALDRARIDPRSLGYVEAHGTGTALGDPIEHTGLALAFARQTSDRGFCALGSVKSNIGHLEGAAGIAGVTKAILQLEHGRIVPSLHADTLNPLIDFVSSPFFVARQAQDWPRLADAPRRAAVSSFGAGGANAHVILEEPPHGDRPRRSASLAGPRLIVLSAQGRNRLTAYAARLAAYLAGVGAGAGPDLDLADVAYSLQVGREAMPERLAFIAADIQDAARRLEAIGRGDGGDWLFVGTVRRVAAGDAEAPFPAPVVTGDLARLARLWTSGAEIDWDSLNIAGDDRGRRIPLPTYPFERVRHWLPVMAPPSVTAASSFVPPDSPSLGAAPPQPLPRDQTAERRLHHDRDDWVLRDHQVAGRRILPGAAHLDFVAGAFGVPAEIRDVAFLAPVVAGSDGITLSLVAGPDGDYRLEGPDGAVRSRGRRQDLIDSASATLSLDGVRLRCPAMTDGTAFYDGLSSFGLDYGPSFRCVETVWTGRDEALARLRLPGGAVGAHLLHPAVLDAALHTVAAIPGDVVRTRPALPFTIDRMTVFHPLPATAWVHALRRGPDSYDLSVAGDDGRVLLDLRGLCLREDRRDDRLPLYLPQWTPVPLPAGLTPALPDPKGVLVLAGTEDADLAARLLEAHSAAPGVPMLIGPDGLPDGAIAQALARVPSADLLYVLAVAAGAEAPRTLVGLRHHQERFLLSLIRLAQALDRAGILARPFHVKVVTAGLHPLHGQEEPRPWSAGLEGICAVLAKEYPRLRVASIDLRAVGGPGDRDPLFDPAAILAEPFQASLDRVSLRGGVRRLRRLARLDTPPMPTRFRKGGHYLVVGGFGVIGREVCLHLARSHGARLTILGRSPQESRGGAIAELTAAGADVLYERCDVTDPLSLEGALARARARFGVLHGVIHSAMTLVDRRVADLSRDDFTAAAAAKVDAVWSLFDAMRAEPLDFLVLFSSGASFDGNQGQAGYVAGNCFADAFARLAAREARFPVHVINWGYWQGDDADRRAFLSRLTEAGIRPIAPAEGIAALDRVRAAGPFQVLATPAAPRLLTGIGVEPDRILRPEGRAAPASGAVFAGKGSVPSVEPPEVALHLAAASRLEDWLAHGLFEVIGRLCVFDVAGARRSRATLARELGIVPAMERQWAWMLSLLTADGVLAEDPVDGTLRVVRPPRDCDIGRLAAEHPTLGPTIAVLRRVLDALPDVLTGARDPIDVLLPGGSLELLSPLYSEDPVMACCNRQVATIVGDYVARRMADDAAAGVRILEIGAGAGATTATVLDALTGRMGALAGRA
ncbi:MAG: SDR family NAD(P)-dependent oxidoreductase, partial [Telmatospirillum sp.]|nr:SDR family NAD(P)-dependent oxidoreductase [Telmatospirillum sp.]